MIIEIKEVKPTKEIIDELIELFINWTNEDIIRGYGINKE